MLLEPYSVAAEVKAYETAEIPEIKTPSPSLEDLFKQPEAAAMASRYEAPAEAVDSPDHYTVGGIETIDYMYAKMGYHEFCGFLLGNVMKYTSRSGHKGAQVEDLKKAAWYLKRLIDLKEKVE